MRRSAGFVAALLVAVAVVSLIQYRDIAPRDGVTLSAVARGLRAVQPPPLAQAPATSAERLPPTTGLGQAAPRPAGPPPPLGSNEVPRFEVDDRGNLVVDGQTGQQFERLLALNDRDEAPALLRKATAELPPGAARQATDAFFAWQHYSLSLAREISPQRPVTDEAGALRQLDALHALRVQQFGAEVAKAYFGDEEDTARRLLAEMQAQRTAVGSSFQERAEQAQLPDGR